MPFRGALAQRFVEQHAQPRTHRQANAAHDAHALNLRSGVARHKARIYYVESVHSAWQSDHLKVYCWHAVAGGEEDAVFYDGGGAGGQRLGPVLVNIHLHAMYVVSTKQEV